MLFQHSSGCCISELLVLTPAWQVLWPSPPPCVFFQSHKCFIHLSQCATVRHYDNFAALLNGMAPLFTNALGCDWETSSKGINIGVTCHLLRHVSFQVLPDHQAGSVVCFLKASLAFWCVLKPEHCSLSLVMNWTHCKLRSRQEWRGIPLGGRETLRGTTPSCRKGGKTASVLMSNTEC